MWCCVCVCAHLNEFAQSVRVAALDAAEAHVANAVAHLADVQERRPQRLEAYGVSNIVGRVARGIGTNVLHEYRTVLYVLEQNTRC